MSKDEAEKQHHKLALLQSIAKDISEQNTKGLSKAEEFLVNDITTKLTLFAMLNFSGMPNKCKAIAFKNMMQYAEALESLEDTEKKSE